MKKILGVLMTVSIAMAMGDNLKLGRIQKFTPSNHDHWMQMTKAARTGELPAFLKQSMQLKREKVRVSGRVEESTRQLNRAISDSELIGRWEEVAWSDEFILTVGSNQEIANPLHVFGLEESEGAITIEGNSTGPIEATYLPSVFGPLAANWNFVEEGESEEDYPLVEFFYLYMGNMDDYVSHPDSIGIIILDDSVSFRFGTAGGKDMENVTTFAGDILYDEEPEWDLPMVRIVHGITIKDTVSVQVIDFMENSETFTVTGEIQHGTISLMAGVQYPIDDPLGSLWDDVDEDDELYIEKFYIEFLSDNTGRFIDSWEDLEYDYSYIDSSAFAWTTWDDTLSITERHEDWDEDEEEYIVSTETMDVEYKIENSVLSISAEFDFCEDAFDDPLSPYACGDSLWNFGLFGLDDVESLIISSSGTHNYDGETGTRTDLVFDQLVPGDGSVIEISSDNAWTDTLVFAWESADHIYGGGDVTYYPVLSGDLDNFFLMTSNTTDNIWKIPYHHIKYYMDQAGLSKATGTWDIRSKGKSGGLIFDGSDDYVDIGAISTNFTTADFSVQAWVNTTSNENQGILLKSNGDDTWGESEFSMHLYDNGQPAWDGYGIDHMQANTEVNDGKWHHVVVIWDYSGSGITGDGKIYIDGVESTATSQYNADANDIKENKLYIGKPNNANDDSKNYFDGSLKEIAIWSQALTASEISSLYNSGSGKTATTVQTDKVVGYWELDEGSGSTVTDESGNSNNGTIHGASWERTQYSANGPFELIIDASGLSVDVSNTLPNQFQLHANFPNPFNPTTSIKYDLPKDALVSLMIFDITGREIRHLVNETQNAGFKAIMWDGTNNYGHQVGTGMYLYQIKAGAFVQTRKMILMK